MWSQERHQRIVSRLKVLGSVGTDRLAEELGVSRETIRRDLVELEAEGLLKRIHGGAIPPHSPPEEPFQRRQTLQQREKQAIGRAAVRLIQPGQSLFVDAGTTTSAFAAELGKLAGVRVVTNSLDIAQTLWRLQEAAEVTVVGGRLLSDVPATYGELTISELSRFHADVAVLSPVALDPRHGAADFDLHEAEVARVMVANAAKVVMLADSSKLGKTSSVQYCTCDQINVLVTDTKAPADVVRAFGKAGVGRVIKAS